MNLIAEMYDVAAAQAGRAVELLDVVLDTPEGELPDQAALNELIGICEVEAQDGGDVVDAGFVEMLKGQRA